MTVSRTIPYRRLFRSSTGSSPDVTDPVYGVASALYRLAEPGGMRVKFDRDTCVGMYQCVAEWDAFEKNLNDGKADLRGSEEEEADVFVVEVPDGEEFDAKFAARVCPVDAIEVYDDDGEQVV